MATCSRCAADNPSGARFCNQCGSALDAQAASAPQARAYTPQHLIDKVLRHRSALEGERKQVTVFFADMAGSTRLADTVDPEDWHRILDEFFSILGTEIHRYEGTINQYTGDGVMALFGAPLAHEDHAVRACHAALALQQSLRRFADRLRLEQGLNLSVRMGINSGEVVVGRIGDDLRMDYTAKGMTVNLAARMEQIAEPGRIYLTRYTAELVESHFRLRDLGHTKVRGAKTPIPVYELLEATDVTLRLDAARARGLTGFIGRRAELAQLDQCLDAAMKGRGGVVLVSGDGGIGKSRLCFEAAQRWREREVRVLHASAVPYSKAVPLLPVQSLLRQRFGVLGEDSAETARRKVAGLLLMADPGLREQLPLVFEFLDIADPAMADSQIPPDARASKVMELFRRFCPSQDSQPAVVMVEDLHWLDAGSEAFLDALCESAGCAPLLLVFNARPGDPPAWLAHRQPLEIRLQPLDAAAMAEMTAELLGDDPALVPLAERIASLAAGNPFFIEESVRSLASEGVLSGSPGAYRAERDVAGIEIPPSVHAVIAGRIDRLDGGSKELLQLAAVLGKTFSLDLLRAVAGGGDEEFERRLQALRSGHYLQLERPQQPVEYGFCHPLFQEVAYGALLSDRRRVLHGIVAAELERRAAALAEPGELKLHLAHHWHEAGEAMPTARWSLAAGAWVVTRDPQEEVRLFKQVIAALDPLPDDPEAVRLVVSARAGIVRASAFYPVPDEEVEHHYAEARQIAQSRDFPLGLAELEISRAGRCLHLARADDAAAAASEAMALAQRLGDDTLEARFRIPILFGNFASGRLVAGLELLDRRDGGRWHQGPMQTDNFMSRGFRALMLACLARFEDALGEAHAALAYAEQVDRSVSWMHANLVDIGWLRGRTETMMSHARKAVSQAQEYTSPLFQEVAWRSLAEAHIANGEAEEARRILADTAALVVAGAPAFQFRPGHLWCQSLCARLLGETELALAQAREAATAARAGTLRIWELRALHTAALLLLDDGLGADAEIARGAELLAWTDCRALAPTQRRLEAAQAEQRGDDETAAALLAQAQAMEREFDIRPLAVPRAHQATA